MSSIASPPCRPMYSRARRTPSAVLGASYSSGVGTRPVTGATMPGLVPQVTWGASDGGVHDHLAVEDGARVGSAARATHSTAASKSSGAPGPPGEPGERGVVGRDHAGAGAALDRHVADGHAALHRERPDRRAGVLDDVALRAPATPSAPMVPRMRSLAPTPTPGSPSMLTRIVRGVAWVQRLGGEDVLDLAGADAERQGPEGAVRRGVAVAADDGHARLGDAELRADHVDDPLARCCGARTAGCRTRRSCARGPRPGRPRAGRRCRPRGRSWARCGRPWRGCGPGGARAGRPGAGRRRPAAR